MATVRIRFRYSSLFVAGVAPCQIRVIMLNVLPCRCVQNTEISQAAIAPAILSASAGADFPSIHWKRRRGVGDLARLPIRAWLEARLRRSSRRWLHRPGGVFRKERRRSRPQRLAFERS